MAKVKTGRKWRTIKTHPTYQLSTDGKVRRKNDKGRLSLCIKKKDNHYYVGLMNPDTRKKDSIRVAQLMGAVWLSKEKTNRKRYVCFRDGNKQNLDLVNIFFGTMSDANACKEKTDYGGANAPTAKLTEIEVEEILYMRFINKKKRSYRQIAVLFEISLSTITLICNGRSWKKTYERFMDEMNGKIRY